MAIKSSNNLQIKDLLSEDSHYLISSKESSSGLIFNGVKYIVE